MLGWNEKTNRWKQKCFKPLKLSKATFFKSKRYFSTKNMVLLAKHLSYNIVYSVRRKFRVSLHLVTIKSKTVEIIISRPQIILAFTNCKIWKKNLKLKKIDETKLDLLFSAIKLWSLDAGGVRRFERQQPVFINVKWISSFSRPGFRGRD